MKLPISPRRLALVLAVLVILITIGSVLAQVSRFNLDGDPLSFLATLDLDTEYTVAGYFGGLLIIIAWILLGIIAFDHRQRRVAFFRHWNVLWIVFFILFLDEVIGIHDKITGPLRDAFNLTGLFFFAWIIPAFVLTLGFGLASIRFLRFIPREIARLFLIAGAVYVTGAMGIEAIGGARADAVGMDFGFYLLADFEELLEMSGMVLFIYAAATYVQKYVPTVTSPPASAPESGE